MVTEIGEARERWGEDVWKQAEDFANNMKSEKRPFYIVYCAKSDRGRQNTFVQTFKAYYARPPAILGILVWFVNNPLGVFEFVPELSSPPDIPLDPTLLSNKASDAFGSIAEKGKQLQVLVS